MCGNRVFRDASKHPKTKVLDCEDDRGLGLFADAAIKKDSFVIEYIGEVIELTEEELEQRKAEYKKEGLEHSYFKQLRAGVYIDPTKKGNDARYMNHSDTPNCMGEKWDVDGEECIGIFAKADIKAGEELTWHYGDGFFSDGHTVNESIAATETLGETVTVEQPDDAMTTPMSKSVGAAEPPATVETGAVANEMDTDTPMVSKASRRVSVGFTTPLGSRIQDSCTTGPQRHPLNNTPLTKLPPPTLQQGAQQQTIENDEGEDSELPSADKPQAGVVCAVWNCTTENRNKTPTWRPGPDGSAQLCNACGDKYSKDKDRVQKHPKREGWYEMLEVRSKRSPQPRGEAPVPPPSSRKRARKESSIVVQGTKGKAPWPKEASMELEKCVKASLDAGIPLRREGGAFENGCKIHTRLGFKMHRKNRYNQPTKSIGCKCNASQDEWCDHIQPRLEADKDSWYMVGNYGNLLQKSRGKKPNTVDDEEDDEPGDGYMSERDFGGTEDDSQTSEEDATDDSESSEEEEGELIPGSARVTASWIDFLKKHWLPLAEQYPQPNEIVRLFSEIDAHFRANGLYYDKDPLQVSILQDRIDDVKETVNQMYNAIDGIDPGGLTGYLTSSDIPSDEKRSSTSTSPTRAPGTPPPSSETLQELTKGSFEKVINEVAPLIKTGASFIDIGCGRGNCCLHWKIFDPKSKVAGVDVNENRIQIAKKVADSLGQDVSFSCEDAADEEGAIEYDVVYSFDKVFTDHDREAIYRRLNASPWKVFVTFRTLKEGDLEGARLVSRLKLSVRQSTQKHTAYVYEKDRLLALYNKAVRSSQSVVE
jgi:SAM-dependent methyltransferase